MRHLCKKPEIIVISIGIGGFLIALFVVGVLRENRDQRYMTMILTRQVEAHSSKIANILSTSSGEPPSQIGDAIFQELQGVPSTSLITRSMVSVSRSSDRSLECIIDLRSFGLEVQKIQALKTSIPSR